jgi:hypothetical protein
MKWGEFGATRQQAIDAELLRQDMKGVTEWIADGLSTDRQPKG